MLSTTWISAKAEVKQIELPANELNMVRLEYVKVDITANVELYGSGHGQTKTADQLDQDTPTFCFIGQISETLKVSADRPAHDYQLEVLERYIVLLLNCYQADQQVRGGPLGDPVANQFSPLNQEIYGPFFKKLKKLFLDWLSSR